VVQVGVQARQGGLGSGLEGGEGAVHGHGVAAGQVRVVLGEAKPLTTAAPDLAGLRRVGGVEDGVGEAAGQGRGQADQVVAIGAIAVKQDDQPPGRLAIGRRQGRSVEGEGLGHGRSLRLEKRESPRNGVPGALGDRGGQSATLGGSMSSSQPSLGAG
jgi:hypothetical protein